MANPHIELICVGTELLTGRVNTHTAFIGQKLFELGWSLAYDHCVGDDEKLMLQIFKDVWKRADIVISAGGLGPTFDDVTRECWSQVTKRPLRQDAGLLSDIEEKFRSRGIFMPSHNKRQADLLQGAEVIPNSLGTAPGQFLKMAKKCLILLPGPARELYPMTESFVLPHLEKIYGVHHSQQKTFLIFGIPESRIDEIVRPTVEKYKELEGCRVIHGILASQSIVSVKFRVEGERPAAVRKATDFLTQQLRRVLSRFAFGEDNDTLASLVGDLLRDKKKTLSVAESCTGGLLSKLLTDRPGSSDYFREGITTYSNESKEARLGVKAKTLKEKGAVSSEIAVEMASGVKKTSGADFTLSITGIAGPDGGTKEKPVGLVYIACATPKSTKAHRFIFKGDREGIRSRAALTALDLLRKELQSR